MTNWTYFTSESVSEGHPDKMADQISDAILDALISDDKHTRAGIETMVKTGLVLVSGEIQNLGGSSKNTVDLDNPGLFDAWGPLGSPSLGFNCQ